MVEYPGTKTLSPSDTAEGTIGTRLRLAREAKGMTQDTLAEKTSISQGAISRIEKGITEDPGVLLLSKLAAALDQSLDALIGSGDIDRHPSLADLFRAYRPARIAAAVGVSTDLVTAWESGQIDLFHTYISPLSKFLGIERGRLIDACLATSGRPPIGP